MTRWSSQSSAVGLLFLCNLNGVRLMAQDPADTTSSAKNDNIYCLLDNCPADTDKPHFGCNNNGSWPAACGEAPVILPINDIIQNYLVDRHNTFRDIVAGGKTHKLPAAARMCKLSWSSDLADLAELLVKRCELRPTKNCISTLKFPAPGYNTVYNKFKNIQSAYRIVGSQLNAWYDQYQHIETLNEIKRPLGTDFEVGHFLRMMVGPSNRLGCAVALTKKDGWNYQWMTCLYSCSPKNDSVPYVDTTEPASSCQRGVDSKFQSLCSEDEVVNSCKYTPLFNKDNANDTASRIRAAMEDSSLADSIRNGVLKKNHGSRRVGT